MFSQNAQVPLESQFDTEKGKYLIDDISSIILSITIVFLAGFSLYKINPKIFLINGSQSLVQYCPVDHVNEHIALNADLILSYLKPEHQKISLFCSAIRNNSLDTSDKVQADINFITNKINDYNSVQREKVRTVIGDFIFQPYVTESSRLLILEKLINTSLSSFRVQLSMFAKFQKISSFKFTWVFHASQASKATFLSRIVLIFMIMYIAISYFVQADIKHDRLNTTFSLFLCCFSIIVCLPFVSSIPSLKYFPLRESIYISYISSVRLFFILQLSLKYSKSGQTLNYFFALLLFYVYWFFVTLAVTTITTFDVDMLIELNNFKLFSEIILFVITIVTTFRSGKISYFPNRSIFFQSMMLLLIVISFITESDNSIRTHNMSNKLNYGLIPSLYAVIVAFTVFLMQIGTNEEYVQVNTEEDVPGMIYLENEED